MQDNSVRLMIEASEQSLRRIPTLDASGKTNGSSQHHRLSYCSADFSERSGASGFSGISGMDNPQGHHESFEKQREMVKQMAERETRKVNIWRRNVFFVVAATAAFVTSMTYVFLDRADQKDFEQSFREFALAIEDSTKFNLKGLMEGTNGLAQVLTSEAINTGSKWPFMTLSSFEVYVRHTRAQGASELVVFAPFVAPEEIEEWNLYSNAKQAWIDDSFSEYESARPDLNPIPSSIYRFGRFKGRTVLKPEDGLNTPYPSAPFWQMSRPPFDTSIVNFNALSEESYQQSFRAMNISRHWVMGIAGPNTLIDYTISAEQHDQLHSASEVDQSVPGFANNHPHTQLIYPVFESKDPSHSSGSDINSPIVAMVVNVLPWDNYLKRLLPNGVNGIYCVLHNSAGQAFTYRIRGDTATYLGPGDWHEPQYSEMEYRINFEDFLGVVEVSEEDAYDYHSNALKYWFSVYPSKEFKTAHDTATPIIFAVVVFCSFSFMTITFILYDRFVTSKNKKITDAATHSNAILASLFPKNVKERLLEEKANEIKAAAEANKNRRGRKNVGFVRGSVGDPGLQNFVEGSEISEDMDKEILDTDPIADLFPEATVLFADLVGFTAWSSTREPTQVFILLETLYRNFDLIAKRRRVYKVETIGDCYVAVTGCPTPRKNHHVIMVRFCMECLRKMRTLTRKLESKLGPDTSSLNMRFGLHSGSVTGGVLRGERSRFQLFGDTMNTAARMESNGVPGKIHLSEATADLLRKHGKGHWLEMREDKVHAKGKGLMQTYWISKITNVANSAADMSEHTSSLDGDDPTTVPDERISIGIGTAGVLHMDEKTHRVVEWTTQSFMTLLEHLAASRKDMEAESGAVIDCIPLLNEKHKSMPLDELEDVISFPETHYDPDEENHYLLSQDIEDQLEVFIGTIATMYPERNSFHNFFHASHVTMSILRIFSTMRKQATGDNQKLPNRLALRISCDPLTVFACAFAALIHDVDHPALPNFLYKNENSQMAGLYAGRCIAEQNSFDVAWKLLLEDRFKKLRTSIVRSEEEASRFRQLVVNSVIATDLFDAALNDRRDAAWEKAFAIDGEDNLEETSLVQVLDRKATVVVEHLIQAADISHTMQHWSIYRKWNTNLFEEMYKAFIDGRSNKSPVEGWYQGELNFFDGHVIPLAKRLISCNCLGLGGDEFLASAEQNRAEWAEKGHEIVAEMVAEVQKLKGGQASVDAGKAEGSVGSNATSKTSETRQSVAETHNSGAPSGFVPKTFVEIDDISEVFEDELEIGENGSVAC